ncbi:hypothetical protein OAH36_05145 [Verrucomicrobia bacterium]|nr:hypothetical protein [Verrucomicrobiota bacterium]
MEQLDKAGSLLAESEKGRQAMRDLLAFLDNGAIGLNEQNQAAIMALLDGAWGEYAGTARDVMRDWL